MGSCRAIYNDIAASTSDFFRPRQKNSLGQGRALGNFLASDEKKPRFRGYIVVYSPPRPHIYITYIPLTYPIYKNYFFTPNPPSIPMSKNLHISAYEGYIVTYSPHMRAICYIYSAYEGYM